MEQGRKHGFCLRNSVVRVIAILAVVLSFTYSIFGTTDVVLAYSCDDNSSTQHACDDLYEDPKCQEAVGAMWISGEAGDSYDVVENEPVNGKIKAYLNGAFVTQGWTSSMDAQNIELRKSKGGSKVDYIDLDSTYLSRGSVADDADCGTWSSGGHIKLSIDYAKFIDGLTPSGGYYERVVWVYRCPVGGSTCWDDPSTIRVKAPTRYRYRTYRYYKDYTISDTTKQTSSDGVRTVTNTQYYKGSSTTTATSTGNRDPEAGASKTSNGNGKTGAVTNRTATLTLYNRERQTANIGFVENITKLSKANDTFTNSIDSDHPFNTRASGSILIDPAYSVTGTTATGTSGSTSGNGAGNVYSSNHDYAVSPMPSSSYVEKCQTLSFSSSITYTGTQKRNEIVRRYFTRTITQTDTNGDRRSDSHSGSAPGSSFTRTYDSGWSAWSTTAPTAVPHTQVGSDEHRSWGSWKTPTWTSATRSTNSPSVDATGSTSIQSCSRIKHPYVYWQTEYTIDGAQNSSAKSSDDTSKTASVDNQWNKTTGVPNGVGQSGQNLFVRSNGFELSYTSFLKQSDSTKPLTSLTGRTQAGSSTTDYKNRQRSYTEARVKQADALYVNYSYNNSTNSDPDGKNGKTDGGSNYRRAIYGITTNTNYALNSSGTGYSSASAIYGSNRIYKTDATTVPGSESVSIVAHYSKFTASNTNTWPATSNGTAAAGKIHYRTTSGSGIIDNDSINLKKSDASHNSIQFGPFIPINAGDYVVYYSGTRLQDCVFEYTTNGGGNVVRASNIRLAHNGTVAAFNMHIASNITGNNLEVRCKSYDNDVRITSITIAKRTTSTHADTSRKNPTLGQSRNYWRQLNYDKTIVVEHGSDGTNRLVSRSAYNTDSGGKSRANIYVHWPYNYDTSATATIPTSTLNPGSTATAKFSFKITQRDNLLVMSNASKKYRTSTKSDMKLQGALFYVPANTNARDVTEAIKANLNQSRSSASTLCDAIKNISNSKISDSSKRFGGCSVVYQNAETGRKYTGSNAQNGDLSVSKSYSFVVPDVSQANIGVKICAVSGVNYADSHGYPDNSLSSTIKDYTNDNRRNAAYASNSNSNSTFTSDPTNNPNWRISDVTCKNLSVRPTFQVWNGSFFTNGYVHTSITAKTPPGLNIDNAGNPATFAGYSGSDTRYYGSWAEYAFLANGAINNNTTPKKGSTGFTSGSHLGYPNGSDSSNYCANSPMSIANIGMAGLACVSSGNRIGSAAISASPSTFLAQIKTHFVDNRSDPPADTKIVYKNSPDTPVNLSSIASIKVKPFNKTNAATDDDFDTYVYIVNGTLTIDQNLCTASTTCTGDLKLTTRNNTNMNSYDDIPQVIIIAKNINIKASVTQIDAWLIATGSNPTGNTLDANGNINTCSVDGSTNITTGANPTLNSTLCKKTLLFNGPVLANKVTLNRTNVQNGQNTSARVSTANLNSDFGSATAAEIFNLRPDTYLWAYRQATKYEYASTVYTKELAPRL